MERRRTILVAPLDWGLGHATRCIPIIKALLKRNAHVVIAGSGSSAQLLKIEFPELKHYTLPAYNPRYSTTGNMVWSMATQLPKFIKTIRQEHEQLNTLIKKEKIDVVISDNRYGCYSTQAKSVLITHQLNILMPANFKFMEPAVNYFNLKQISCFDTCWVPAPDKQLLGHLVPAKLPANTRFIGYLSRFERVTTEHKYNIVAVASGPEPQRTILVDMLRKQLHESGLTCFLIHGNVQDVEAIHIHNNITEANYLSSEKLNTVMQQGDMIIARSGYSTLMDVAKLGKKAIFIATPGQTEQQYLASQLMAKGIAFSMLQSAFDLKIALKKSDKFSGFTKFGADEILLNQAIETIL